MPRRAWRSAIAMGLRGQLWDGDAIPEFERAFARFIGTPEAVAVPSGRAGDPASPLPWISGDGQGALFRQIRIVSPDRLQLLGVWRDAGGAGQ